MKIVILGAGGKTGTHLVSQALEQGYAVTAFVRDESKIKIRKPNLTVKVGDARNQSDLQAAMAGKDAVVYAIGSKKLKDDVITATTEATIRAMHAVGVRRIVMLSSFLMTGHDKPGLLMKAVDKISKGVKADKASAERMLQDSGLDWTIVYATPLKGGEQTGNIRVVDSSETVGIKNSITRADVAHYMLDVLDNESMHQKTVTVTTK